MARPGSEEVRRARKTRVTGPPNIDAMARTANDYSPEEIAYLAGFWDNNQNMKSPNDVNAVAIDKIDLWPNSMATMYGGESRKFTANNGREWYGWFMSLRLKVAILDFLWNAGALKYLGGDEDGVYEYDRIRAKLLKAIGEDE